MNEWDRDNLEFLLHIDNATFDEWYEQADDDDIQYARELIDMGRKEIIAMKRLEDLDPVEDVTEANKVLNRFRL
jgi:hypothetical protein